MPRGQLYRPSAAASGPTRSGGGRRHRAERPPSAPSRPCRIVGVEQLRQRPPLLRPRRRLLVHPLRHCWIRGQQQRRPSAVQELQAQGNKQMAAGVCVQQYMHSSVQAQQKETLQHV
uniref:Uncharacterized protein n=1 Tax=Oryza rufipogon TaxID=4529 RepID=A0A0E0PB48_ORYRU